VEQGRGAAVLDGDALGTPRRAGRVYQIREITLVRDWRRILAALACDVLTLHVQIDDVRVRGRQSLLQTPLRQYDACPCVFEHQLKPFRRIGRVERHVRPARFQYREQGDDHLGRAFHEDADE
jgi:hypothetical protein